MIPLPVPEPRPARCRRCRRVLTDAESLGYRIGPVCRVRLGIAEHQVVRVSAGRPWFVDGQLELFAGEAICGFGEGPVQSS